MTPEMTFPLVLTPCGGDRIGFPYTSPEIFSSKLPPSFAGPCKTGLARLVNHLRRQTQFDATQQLGWDQHVDLSTSIYELRYIYISTSKYIHTYDTYDLRYIHISTSIHDLSTPILSNRSHEKIRHASS